MKKIVRFLFLIVVFGLTSCKMEKKKESAPGVEKTNTIAQEKEANKADSLVSESIRAHGGELYHNAHYQFTFREKQYTFRHSKRGFIYTMSRIENGDELKYVLENGKLSHTINGVETELSAKDIVKYTEDVNSVIYFATLPYKLNDRAVKKVYEGQITVKGKDYDMVTVTFDEEGGGVDYDDEFLYWINSDTKTVDYLAYNYLTNEGGVRFRSAYNPRTVGGIRFQDYINYKAPIDTPLKHLSTLYEKGELEELSQIITENVVNLKE